MDIFEQFPATVDNPTGFSREKLEGVEYTSYSRMSKLFKSPWHYKEKYIDEKEDEPTDAMEFGSIFHLSLLETSEFKKRYLITPDKDDYDNLDETVPQIKEFFKKEELKVQTVWKKDELIERITKINPEYRKQIWSCIEKDFMRDVTDDHIVITAEL